MTEPPPGRATEPPTYTLRPVVPGDFETLYAIHRAAMGDYVVATYGPWDDAVQREFFQARLDRAMLQVIEVEGQVAGILEVDARFQVTYVQNIELAPAFQRRGIGGAILRAVQAEAAARGATVELQVMRVNPARSLYERLGFQVTGDRGTHWEMRWRCPG